MKKTESNKQGINLQIWYPILFVAVLWIIKWTEISTGVDMSDLGILPRRLSGLKGVLFAPLVHGDWNHLVNNSIPLIILGIMLFYFYRKAAYMVWMLAYLSTGILVWMFARTSYHIGASGLLYAITSFVFFSGLLRKNGQLIAASLLVAFLYGSMVWGVLPIKAGISWESHLMGGIVGLALAWAFRDVGPKKKVYAWEWDDDDLEGVEPYWELKEPESDHTADKPEIKVFYHHKEEDKHEN